MKRYSFWQELRALFGLCPDGGKHCRHFDYKRGRVAFFRCCKCKLRTGMEIDPE